MVSVNRFGTREVTDSQHSSTLNGFIRRMLTLSFGGGSHLGGPYRGALLGRVQREGGKTSSDQYPG